MDDGPAGDAGNDADAGTDAGADTGVDTGPEPATGGDAEPVVDTGEPGEGTDAEPAAGTDEPPPGLVTVRGAIYGVALLWLAAMSGFGALQAAVYGATTASQYLLLAVAAAALSVTAGYASLRAFGLK